MEKIPVGVLGATGMVGQQYIALLANHPWFEVRYVAASPRSAGKSYKDAVAGRWHAATGDDDIPGLRGLEVQDANNVSQAVAANKKGNCAFVFSALEMGKDEIRALEESYAAAGFPVISNASAHRWTADVPMLIAEVNPGHADITPSNAGPGAGTGALSR
jgi:aspartate-semialdehyde dehydrogenase